MSINRGTTKWKVYCGKSQSKMDDDLGCPHFRKPPYGCIPSVDLTQRTGQSPFLIGSSEILYHLQMDHLYHSYVKKKKKKKKKKRQTEGEHEEQCFTSKTAEIGLCVLVKLWDSMSKPMDLNRHNEELIRIMSFFLL